MSNSLPKLSPEQQSKALEKSIAARRERAALKAELASGVISLTVALDDPRSQRIPIKPFLCSVPGVGVATCKKLMQEIGISPDRRVGGLGVNQRAELIDRLEKDPTR